MAFTLTATTNETVTQLNDGAPFRFRSLEKGSGAGVVRHSQRGPLQDGVTDLGYRLQPRTLTLNLVFQAGADAILDGYRDSLNAAFPPLESLSTTLTVTRDDGEVRTLTCFRTGEIEIALDPADRVGHVHRAAVKLRAANPLWQGTVANSAVYTGQWWLAGGSITAGNVLEHVEYPTVGQLYAGSSVAAGSAWTIAAKGFGQTPGVLARYVFDTQSGRAVLGFTSSTDYGFFFGGVWADASLFGGTDDEVWFLVSTGASAQGYRNNVATGGSVAGTTGIGGTARWRSAYDNITSSRWNQTEIPKAAVFKQALSAGQRTALYNAMLPATSGTVFAVNDGDVNAYPYLQVFGPVTGPVITNETTGAVIDLTGITLSSSDVLTLDLRTGAKTVTNATGIDYLGSATTVPVGIAGFSLAPAPIATGGTNYLVLSGGSVGNNAYITAQHTNQYMSF